MLSTDGDSDRCFATFYLYQGNPTSVSSNRLWLGACLATLTTSNPLAKLLNKVIKPRFPNQKTAFFTSENGVLQSENRVFLTIP